MASSSFRDRLFQAVRTGRKPCPDLGRWSGSLVLFLTGVVATVPAHALKLGALELEETLGASAEYNTNINTSEDDPVADVVLQARFGLNGSWKVSRHLTMAFGAGIGYRRYVGGSEFQIDDTLIRLVPDTSFDFDVRVSDSITLNVSDSLTFSENATDIALFDAETGELETNLFSFERVSNRAAVRGEWAINRNNMLSGELYRADTIPLNDRFEDYRRTQVGLSGRWTRNINAALAGGLSGALFRTTYATDFNNDSEGHSWGPFLEYRVTENITLLGDISRVHTEFEAERQPGVSDQSEYDNMEWGVKMNHAFNAKMSYTLEYRHSSDLGYISNFRVLETANATFAWQATRTGQAYFSASYQWGEDSGGVAPDDWQRLFLTLGYNQPIWTDFELSTRVRWTDKDSVFAGRSYEQFSFYLGILYHFPR